MTRGKCQVQWNRQQETETRKRKPASATRATANRARRGDQGQQPLHVHYTTGRTIDTMADLQEMRRHIVDELTPARNWKARGNGADGYVCPLCGSGGRGTRDSDGALSVKGDGVHWHCFSCDQGGDIYDLFMLRDNLTASEACLLYTSPSPRDA